MAEPPPPPPSPPADDQPFPLNTVIGITVGGAVGLVLLVICCFCCFKYCCKRRRRFRQDLEQPLDLKGYGNSSQNPVLSARNGLGPLGSIKESELVVSKNMAVQLDEHDVLVANGLDPATHSPGKLSQVNLQLQHSSSAHARLQTTPSAGGGPMSILRWLETADLPRENSGVNVSSGGQATSPQPGGVSSTLPTGVPLSMSLPHGSSRFSGFSMRAIIGRLDTGELAEMRRRLLLAAGTVYHGDSSAVPLDVKGIVFSRLPPSRMATPAPSTVMDTASVANSAISRSVRVKRNVDLTTHDGIPTSELGTPEQQALQAAVLSSRSLTRHSGTQAITTTSTGTGTVLNPVVHMGSNAGISFASFGSLARTSLKANGGVEPSVLSHTQEPISPLPVSRKAADSPHKHTSKTGLASGQAVDTSLQSPTAYTQAMAVLEQAANTGPMQPQQQQQNGLPPRPATGACVPSRSTPTRVTTTHQTVEAPDGAAVNGNVTVDGNGVVNGPVGETVPMWGGMSSASSLTMFHYPTVQEKGQVVGTPAAGQEVVRQHA